VKLRPLQVKQRDQDCRSTRPASPDDIRDELTEAAILAVHLIGKGKKTRALCFGMVELESVSGHIGGRADNVICDADVRRVYKRGASRSRKQTHQ